MSEIKVILNNIEQVTKETNLDKFLNTIPNIPAVFAVAVNGEIIPLEEREHITLKDKDIVDVFAFMAGG